MCSKIILILRTERIVRTKTHSEYTTEIYNQNIQPENAITIWQLG